MWQVGNGLRHSRGSNHVAGWQYIGSGIHEGGMWQVGNGSGIRGHAGRQGGNVYAIIIQCWCNGGKRGKVPILICVYPSLASPEEMKYFVTFFICSSVFQHQPWGKLTSKRNAHGVHMQTRKQVHWARCRAWKSSHSNSNTPLQGWAQVHCLKPTLKRSLTRKI